jgi:3-deoxy-D-manno-octulosonic-acid transferase
LRNLQKLLKDRFIWLAASTHPREEVAIFEAHLRVLKEKPGALLILCPRDPSRGAEVRTEAKKAGLNPQVQSLAPYMVPETDVFIADSIGEMGLWYSLCDRAFIGGSLEAAGGHNPYEAMHLNCAVIHGPFVGNFTRDYDAAHDAGAALLVTGATELAQAVLDKKTLKMRKKASRLLRAGRENLRDCADTVLRLLE